MRQVLQFLSNVFVTSPWQPAGDSAGEMTLHDALRLCAAACSGQCGNAKETAWTQSRRVAVIRYRSDSDLSSQWRGWYLSQPLPGRFTVILVLGSFLCGDLRDLVRRQRPADRLILVPQVGHWPGTDSFGDLALASRSLGWSSIEMCRDLGDAIGMEMAAMKENDVLLFMLPLDGCTAARS